MDLNKNQAELDALKKITPADTSKIEAAEKKLKESKSAVAALQGIEKNKGIVKALDSAMSKGMTASLAKKIADLDKEITKLRGHLAQCNAEFQRGVNTIVGVVEEKKLPAASGDQAGTDAKLTCVMANEHETGADRNLLMGGAQPAGQPDPWTKIIFTSSASSESSSSTEKSMSREAKAKIKAFWWGAQANTSSSEASKYVFTHILLPFCFGVALTSILGNYAKKQQNKVSVVPCKSFLCPGRSRYLTNI